MEPLIRFFINVGKLKGAKRPGWVLRGIKDPESVADHAFRVLVLAWVFGTQTSLNVKKLLKLALVHSLSAVYIEYISPYDKLIEYKDKKDFLKKYPALLLRAPIMKKREINALRFEEEKKAIDRLTKALPEAMRHEIRYLWLDFQHKTSKEAKYLWVLDRLENLIQALEYKSQLKESLLTPFLQQTQRITTDKKILKFVESLNQYFTKGRSSVKNRGDRNLINFIIEVGKTKSVLRRGWVIRGVKKPESLAAHCFRSAIIAWFFSSRRRINQEAVIITAAIHDLFTTVIGDLTPYDESIVETKSREKKVRIIESLPWLGSRAHKELIAKQRLEREAKALNQILKYLPLRQRRDANYFWLAYKTGTSREGRYFRQIDRIEALLQALEYQSGDKNIPISSFWLQLKELLDDPILIEFVQSIDEYYFKKGFGRLTA